MLLLGEAPGEDEVLHKPEPKPFVGASGKQLDSMLASAGINRSSIVIDNVVRCRPPDNQLDRFAKKAYEACREHTDRLFAAVQPNITVLIGDVALQAIAGKQGIMAWRGTVIVDEKYGKLLPMVHPAMLFHGNWPYHQVGIWDLRKALAESASPNFEPWREDFQLWPTLTEVATVIEKVLARGEVAIDIEMCQGAMVMLSLGWGPHEVLSIPLVKLGDNQVAEPYWEEGEQLQLWRQLSRVLLSPKVVKVFQNGSYDIARMETFGLRVVPPVHDTLHMHHTLWAELPHSLNFLASTYTRMPRWKHKVRLEEAEEADK